MNLLKPLAIVATREQLPVPVPQPQTLNDFAAAVKAGHEKVMSDAVAFAGDAIVVGQMLLALKDEMRARKLTGVWTAFVEHECGVPIRSAQRYMKKAQEKAKLAQMLGDEATACRVLVKRDAASASEG